MPFFSESFEAIGTTVQVTVMDRAQLADAAGVARAELEALDLACSRFREDSEITALNASRGRGRRVSPLLYAVTEIALRVAQSTDGLVDPTVGGALRSLGYDRDFDLVVRSSPRPAFTPVPASGWRSVRLGDDGRTIAIGRAAELDLGATAKAFAADRIVDLVRAETGAEVLVSIGGDVAVRGAPDSGWPIHVGDDHRVARGGQTVAIHGGALATSSTTVRRWIAGGVSVHHIVDPRTGAPAPEYWQTVSVTAPTCVEANAAATAAVVLGMRAVPWLSARSLPARLARRDGVVETIGGWPDEQPADGRTGAQQTRRARTAV